MRINALSSYLFFPIVLIVLCACKDHREGVEPPRFRLKRSVRTTAYRADTKDTTTIMYVYDAKGYLSEEVNVATSTFGDKRYVS